MASVDTRVVKMQFDNAQFEKGIQQSVSSIKNLKDNLDFTGAVKGIENVEKASKSVDVSGLSGAIETIKVQFSAMETIAIGALMNIGSQAVDAGEKLIKSLSVDNISAGWSKYERRTAATQTIVNATGKSVEEVDAALEKLAWYSDETSYDFTAMVETIGKFTASGVELDSAVDSVMGIANAAAVAGVNTTDANRAFYNLAQAMGSGSLKLQDYKSLELLVMTTKDFQQTLVDAALDLGTLTQDMSGFTSTTTDANGSVGQFNSDLTGLRDSLSSGWVTSDVMELAFSRYAEYTNKIYDVADAYDTVSEAMEAVGKEGYEFSAKAFESAQVAKTFTDVVDSVKDAVSTKWQQTFQLIFGNFEESIKLWTDLANRLWDMFAASGDLRNEILELWRAGSGGYNREILVQSFTTLLDTAQRIIDVFKKSYQYAFFGDVREYAQTVANGLTRMTQRFNIFVKKITPTDAVLTKLRRTFTGFFSIFKIGYNAIKPFITVFKRLFEALFPIQDIGGSLLDFFAKIGDAITNFKDDSEVLDKWRKTILSFGNVLVVAAKNVRQFFDAIIDWFKNSPMMESIGSSFKNAADNIRSGFLSFDLKPVQEFSKSIAAEFDKIPENVKLVLDQIYDFLSKSFGSYIKMAKEGINTISDKVTTEGSKLVNRAKSLLLESQNESYNNLKDGLDKQGELIEEETKSFGDKFKEFFANLQSTIDTKFPGLGRFVANVKEMFKKAFDSIASYFEGGFSFEGLINLLSSGLIVSTLAEIRNIFKTVSDLGKKIAKFLEPFLKIGDTVKKLLNDVGGVLKAWQSSIKADAIMKIAKAIAILAGSLLVLALIDPNDLENATASLTVIIFALSALVKAFGTLSQGMSRTVDKSKNKLIAKITGISANFNSMGLTLIGLGIALMAVAGAIKIIADLDPIKLAQGLGIVVFLMSALIGVAAALSKLKIGVRFKAFAGGIVALALGLLLLCAPIAILGNMKWETLGKAAIAIGGLVLMFGLLSRYGKTSEANMPKLAAGLIIFAVAIGMLVPSIAILGALPWQGVLVAVGAIAGLIAVMGLVSRYVKNASKMVKLAEAMIILASAFDVFAFGLLLLVPVIAQIIALGPAEFAGGLAAILAVFLGLGYAANKLGENAKGIETFSKAALKLGIGIALAAGGLYYFCKIINDDFGKTVAKGITALQQLIKPIGNLVTALVVELVRSIANMAGPVSEAILNATVQSLFQLEEHLPEILERVLSIILKILVGLRKYIPKLVNEAGKLIIDFVTEVINFAQDLNIDSNVLGAVILGLIGLVAIFDYMASLKKKAKDAFVVGELIILITAELAIIMIAMSQLGTGEDFFLIATGLAEGLAAMAGAFAILDKIKADPASAAKTAAAFDVFFGIVTAMFVAIGGIFSGIDWLANQINPKEDGGNYILEWLNMTVLIFQKIGEALGGFVGGIIGGIVGGVLDSLMSTLPTLGMCLSLFWVNAQIFVQGVSSIPSNFLDSVANITAAILLLTAADFINSILNFFGMGGDSWVSLGKELVSFAPYLRDFGIIISQTDPAAIESGANAALALGKFANSLPARDGKLQEWFGNKETLGEFGSGLAEFGTTLVAFDKSIRGIDSSGNEHPINTELIKNAAEASGYLADFANKLPDHDGKLQWFLGDATLTTFATELSNFGPELVNFCNTIAGLDTSGVDKAIDAASVVAGFENTLPDHNGAVQIWTGDQTLSQFATGMKDLGTGLDEFCKSTTNVKEDAVRNATTCAGMLAALETGLPREGGLFGFLYGDHDMASFGDRMEPLGEGLKKFSDKISTIPDSSIEKATTAAGLVKALGNSLPTQTSIFDQWFGSGTKISFDNISQDLPLLGAALAAFSLEMLAVSSNSLEKGKTAAEMLQLLNTALPTQTSVFDQWFGSGTKISFDNISADLPTLGTAINKFAKNVNGTSEKAFKTGKWAAELLSELYTKLPTGTNKLENFFGENQTISWDELGKGLPALGRAIEGFATACVDVNSDALQTGINAASLVLELYNKLPYASSLYDKIFGDGTQMSMATIAEELPGLGDSLVGFVNKFKNTTSTQLSNARSAATTLKTITTNLPVYSSFRSKIFGTGSDNGSVSITTVAKELPGLGTAISDFLTNVGEVDDNDINAAEITGKIMSAIGDNLPDDKDWWEKLTGGGQMSLTDFGNQLKGLADGIKSFAEGVGEIEDPEGLNDAIDNIGKLVDMESMLGMLDEKNNLTNFSNGLKTLGETGVDYFTEAFKSKDSEIEDAAQHMLTYMGVSLQAHKESLDITANDIATSISDAFNNETYLAYFTNSAEQMITNLKNGLEAHTESTDTLSPTYAMGYVVTCMRMHMEKYKPRFKDTGINLVKGFVDGINEELGLAEETSKGAANKILSAFNQTLSIASPSKETYKSARFFILGFVKSIIQNGKMAYDAVDEFGNTTLDNMNYIIQKAVDYASDNLITRPVITPVLDLQSVREGVAGLNGMLGKRSVSMGTEISFEQSKKLASKIKDKDVSFGESISSEISRLREDMATYNERLENLQIVLDTGAVVGATTPLIDKKLGQRAVRAGRRN